VPEVFVNFLPQMLAFVKSLCNTTYRRDALQERPDKLQFKGQACGCPDNFSLIRISGLRFYFRGKIDKTDTH
jgi:hypothetical protein